MAAESPDAPREPSRSASESADPAEDLYVFSDLHLGEGWSPETRRHSRLESFFYDQEFANLVDRILVDAMARRSRVRLILNGDVFDFLAVLRLPDHQELRREGFRLQRIEHRVGLASSARKSAWKMSVILRGHPVFFRSLLRAVRRQAKVTIIRGNHDVELFWPEVQERFFHDLAAQAEQEGFDDVSEATLRESIDFQDWFYYEPGRAYVEHGHQYEPSNSFSYNLYPVQPAHLTGAESDTLDYPTGSHFVRHVFNRIKQVDPFSTYFVSWERYLWLVGRASFFDILRILTLHVPFLMRALRTARFFELHGMEHVARVHEERMVATAAAKNMPLATVRAIDDLMVEPVGKTKYSLMQEVMRPVFRTFATVVALTLLSIASWFFVFNVIQSTGWIADNLLTKASFMAILAVVSVFGVFYAFLRVHRRLSATPDPFGDFYRERAERIAELVDVPFVTMGHTHGPDLRPFRRRKGFYGNTGTWIANPSPWDMLKSKARQFTFIRLRGVEPELLRWDDAAARWEVVPLLEDYIPSPLERLIREDDRPPGE